MKMKVRLWELGRERKKKRKTGILKIQLYVFLYFDCNLNGISSRKSSPNSLSKEATAVSNSTLRSLQFIFFTALL